MNEMNAITGETFRQVLGHLPTGVTVITADTRDGRAGMTANSVTSVSLEPPLILFCPAKSSATWPLIRDAGRFCVNVMASHHQELTRAFARKGVDRFAGVEVVERAAGPALSDAVAWLDCDLYDEHDAGDHTVVLARVLELEAQSDRSPLVFFQGRYGTFGG
jgi:3-hydroxy-9,10-secoandrosta-1,3,5(10)-triene-9,17-dione monooxygenase reductase component